ncbi:NADH-quinone oxidoreductase subunit NuoF [Sulfurospirillum sp. T05]|uniref:NADH-quinone oxidoreductase subunit NuoF n=1 Tax=Sulfurospirillum tamanense TaxID=2813362 RepID=A0ABS2WPA2_9BACT|nr:NADH-quinone oxidoreductase subunit NuoF [Sulfurospirillum tamanensis]MBN2963522.1 NADH-quinone oxidoreductase subunit NuoF [Sulfurospirillum tamanensis]
MRCSLISRLFSIPGAHTLDIAKANGRYGSLPRLFSLTPEAVTEEVVKSGLRGKGGGGSPTGEKWLLMPPLDDKPRYLVVNADESEPGTFKDRQILEYDPHLLIEGMIASAYALHVKHAYVYIRGEYHFWAARFETALKEAYGAGLLGKRLDITLHRGAGAYICGEKTALLESLEGKRGHPRLKPHTKEPEWLFGHPAVVNNVETIASVPYIIEHGFEAYRAFGTPQSPGTMLFGLSGHVTNPGIYELAFGTSMQWFLDEIGGGVKEGKALKAIVPGGSSCSILKGQHIPNVTLDYESLKCSNSTLGTGGMIIMDETVSIPKAMKNLLEFYHHESCGQCTPCREGTGWMDRILAKVLNGRGKRSDIDLLLEISMTMNGKTICVFAPAVADMAVSYIHAFPEEFYALCPS